MADGADYASAKQLKGQLGRLGVLHVDQLPKETEDFFIEHLSIRRTRESSSHILSDFIWKHPARPGDFWKIPGLSRLNGLFSQRQAEKAMCIYYAAIHPRRIKQIRPPPNYPHSVDVKLDV